MFYPADSLRRGGRFYLCWVADSWPLKFEHIPSRQLWSQDICELCDCLLEVVWQESGFVSARFSLRLSSQLLRGLVRLYKRKVTTFLEDLCQLNSKVSKQINKKWGYHEPTQPRVVHPRAPAVVITEVLDGEDEGVEERIRNSGNAVANIADITLKEAELPQITVTYDGFGEENPDQAFQLLNDRTLEQMLAAADASLAQHSGHDAPMLDLTEKSHDKTRLMLCEVGMERISEVELSMFRKSGDELTKDQDMEKEIPPIPEIPIPDIPDLPLDKEIAQNVPEVPTAVQAQPPELILEELEGGSSGPRRRKRGKRLIVDKYIKISGAVVKERLNNIRLELRCENGKRDVIDNALVPAPRCLQGPACIGWRPRGRMSPRLVALFQRNLERVENVPRDCHLEAEVMRRARAYAGAGATLETIVEGQEASPPQHPANDTLRMEACPARRSTVELQGSGLMPPGEGGKRAARDSGDVPAGKKLCLRVGYVSFRESRLTAHVMRVDVADIPQTIQEPPITDTPKQYRRDNQPIPQEVDMPMIPQDTDVPIVPQDVHLGVESGPVDKQQQEVLHVSQMLERAGLADVPGVCPRAAGTHKKSSDGTETPLGSLDRTSVDLGEPEVMTDAQRFIRREWGTQGTMLKIVKLIRRGVRPVTVRVLVDHGPVLPSKQRLVAARCFEALMKLRRHMFIELKKNDETLEIEDIVFGSKIKALRS